VVCRAGAPNRISIFVSPNKILKLICNGAALEPNLGRSSQVTHFRPHMANGYDSTPTSTFVSVSITHFGLVGLGFNSKCTCSANEISLLTAGSWDQNKQKK